MQIRRKRASEKELREWLVILAALLITGLFFAILHYLGVQVCFLRKYTGYPCLFCGGSRAAFFLIQGRLPEAFAIQPLASLALLLGAFTGTLFYATLLIKRELLLISLSNREKLFYPLLALVLALLNWVYLLLK